MGRILGENIANLCYPVYPPFKTLELSPADCYMRRNEITEYVKYFHKAYRLILVAEQEIILIASMQS